MLPILVGITGALGALARFLVDGAVQDRTSGVLPLGTFTVNVIGSFVLGMLTGLVLFHGLAHDALAVAGTGFCGGFTTWSTASWETVQLAEQGEGAAALLNALGGVAACLAVAGLGLALAAA